MSDATPPWIIELRFNAAEADARELLAKLSAFCGPGSVVGLRRDEHRGAWRDPMPLPVPPSIFQMDVLTVIKGLREMATMAPRGKQREWFLDAAVCVDDIYERAAGGVP